MAATIWKGAIAFGLVNIPVRLQSAVRSADLEFRLLHEKDLCPVKYERVCKRNGKAIPWDEIVKGYEYEKGKFVVLTDEDFAKAALATSKTFEIRDFVREADIDSRFFEKPYYLMPDSTGKRAYALLVAAMRNTESAGIGTITLRQKQYLACIKVVDNALILDLMRFADEVVNPESIRFPTDEDFRPQELKMAEQLIENLTETFDPEKYKDEYRANLMKLIRAKMKGKDIEFKEAEEPDTSGVIDLMARLQESLEREQAGKSSKKKSTKSRATRKKKSA